MRMEKLQERPVQIYNLVNLVRLNQIMASNSTKELYQSGNQTIIYSIIINIIGLVIRGKIFLLHISLGQYTQLMI